MAAGDAFAGLEGSAGGGEPSMEGNTKAFWRLMEDHEMDSVFERLQEVVLALKQKIKGGTATEEECFQALALVNQANLTACLPLPKANSVEEDPQERGPGLEPSPTTKAAGRPGDSFSLMDVTEGPSPRGQGDADGVAGVSSRLPCRLHSCSQECLVERPWSSYKGGNPLNLPLLCGFQRRHAKPSLASKVLEVVYKAPCGRSLRNFEEVQGFLLQTECSFLFLDHFSFNTYVQVFRNYPSRKGLVFDPDLSGGAEATPVSFCNEVDNEQLPYFKYRKTSWPHGHFLNNSSSVFLDSCGCADGCRDTTKCACRLLTWRSCSEDSASPRRESSYGYKYKRLDRVVPSGIYECSLSCSCNKGLCRNRVVQHGLQVRLQVFKTEKKGWGVRCLDDIDKGTFVCTYAGRLMSKAESRRPEGGSWDAKEGTAENSESSQASRKRKVHFVCSDSETEFVQAGHDRASGKDHPSPAEAESQANLTQSCSCKDSNWSSKGIKGPQTRMSVLQSCWGQQGTSDATSSEDESSVCHRLARRRLIAGTRKREESRFAEPSKSREQANAGPSETTTDGADESLLSGPCLSSEAVVRDDRSIEKQFMDIFWTESACKGKNGENGQEPVPKEVTEGNRSWLKQFNREDLCLLDATREGNVGRFLNHSCCPNLFVQSVFVETHNRNFPWVAFFTNRHVKAGTELTWDYGYTPGSLPETEIPCLCGSHKCRKKIL